MASLLRLIVNCKPAGLKERSDLWIVTAQVPQHGAMGEDETQKRRVMLKELRAVKGKNINRSELGNVVGQNPGIGGFGFVRSIKEEVADGFSGRSKREVWFSGEDSGETEYSGDQYQQERGAVGLAGPKNTLNAEGGKPPLDAPKGGKKEGGEVTIRGQKGSNETFEEVASQGDKHLPAVRMGVLKRSKEGVTRWCAEIPVERPVV